MTITGYGEAKRGSALITLLVIIAIVAYAGAAMMAFAKQQTYAMSKIKSYLKAQSYAEAGANEAYSQLKTNFAAADNAALFPAKQFGDGSYDATVTKVTAKRASISCVGSCGGVTALVKVDVQNFGVGTGATWWERPDDSPWSYTVFCNGYIRMNGSGTMAGRVHVNNYFDCNGSFTWGDMTDQAKQCWVSISGAQGLMGSGNGLINGRAAAPVIDNKVTVNGTKTIGPVATIEFPVIDLTPYYNIAAANGQVLNGNQTIGANTSWNNVPGGVKWINGTLLVKSGKTLATTGTTIIATGSIDWRGGAQVSPKPGFPAIVSKTGSIDLSGSHTINGLVYAPGNITWKGSGSFDGTLMCGGNMTFNGSSDIVGYANAEPNAQGGSTPGTASDQVGVTAWQK